MYPLSLILKERLAMEAQAVKVLQQCINLRELLWTRKGALTDSCVVCARCTSSLISDISQSLRGYHQLAAAPLFRV